MTDTRRILKFWVHVTAPESVSLENPVVPYLIDRRLRDIVCDLGYMPSTISWEETYLQQPDAMCPCGEPSPHGAKPCSPDQPCSYGQGLSAERWRTS
jgi:hypothetical protein